MPIAFETIETDAMVAACNGGGGSMGHPRVYLNLAPSGRVECPYCSRQYVNSRLAEPRGNEIAVPQPGHD